MYNPTLSLTSVPDGVGGQCHASAALPRGKTWYPLYRRVCGPRGQSGWVRKISSSSRIRSLDRPAHSESLYWLSYPSPLLSCCVYDIYLCKILLVSWVSYWQELFPEKAAVWTTIFFKTSYIICNVDQEYN